jgi:hypothetical protein
LFDIVKVHYNKIGGFNMYISNWVFRPAPGTHAEVVQNSQEFKRLWEKHGANECHLLNLQGGDVGCMSFIAQFDDAEGYGKTNDAIVADTEFQELMAKTSALGGEWVRHNLARALF